MDFEDTSDVSDAAIEAARRLVGGDAALSSYNPPSLRADARREHYVGDRALIVIARLLRKHEPESLVDPVDEIVLAELIRAEEEARNEVCDINARLWRTQGPTYNREVFTAAKRLYLMGVEKGREE